MPVISQSEFLLDDVPDQQDLGPAHHGGDGKSCQRGNEDHRDAADNAGNGQRESYPPEGLEFVRSQILRGVDDILIDLRERIVDRQDHERQKVIDHTDHNGSRRIDDMDGRQMDGILSITIFLQEVMSVSNS